MEASLLVSKIIELCLSLVIVVHNCNRQKEVTKVFMVM